MAIDKALITVRRLEHDRPPWTWTAFGVMR
jgi:hypothetical protein